MRRLLDVRGFVPGHQAPHETVEFRARDGVRLVASFLPSPPDRDPQKPAVVLAPGFAAHRRKPAYVVLAERLARVASVLALDLRGHGDSDGRSTFGDREAMDVRAAVSWLRRRGHRWVAAVGASMGGAAVLRAAGCGTHLDAVCSISAPAAFVRHGPLPVRALVWTMRSVTWRLLVQAGTGVRIAPRWAEPRSAAALVGGIAPTPLLLVHGEDDAFLAPGHMDLLSTHAGPGCVSWREAVGFGHAEDGFTPLFVDRLAQAVAQVRRTGAWPPSSMSVPRGSIRPAAHRLNADELPLRIIGGSSQSGVWSGPEPAGFEQ